MSLKKRWTISWLDTTRTKHIRRCMTLSGQRFWLDGVRRAEILHKSRNSLNWSLAIYRINYQNKKY